MTDFPGILFPLEDITHPSSLALDARSAASTKSAFLISLGLKFHRGEIDGVIDL